VWQSWLLPVRNSPYSSVIDMVSMPPPTMLSRSRHPVVMRITSACRCAARSDADWKQSRLAAILLAPVKIFSTLASEIPLILANCRLLVMMTASAVMIPAS